jgi:hypothetical protein
MVDSVLLAQRFGQRLQAISGARRQVEGEGCQSRQSSVLAGLAASCAVDHGIRDRHPIPSHAYAAESRQQSRHRFRRALHLCSWSCRITGYHATSSRKPMRSEHRLPDLMRAASHRRYACTSRVHGCRSARLGVLLYLKLRQCTSGWLRTH